MARLARLSAAGQVHLLVQRGNNGQPVFIDRPDREACLALLREAAATQQVAIHAYALTDQEILLLATPADDRGLSRMMQSLGRGYVVRFNRRHGRSGTLWEGRFRSTVVEVGAWLQDGLCFVETAPQRAGLAADAAEYPWSSARHHLGLSVDPLVTDHPSHWTTGNTPFEREAAHRRHLEQALPPARHRRIRDAMEKGWALGSEAFVAAVEAQTQRRARPGTRGRPRKRTEVAQE